MVALRVSSFAWDARRFFRRETRSVRGLSRDISTQNEPGGASSWTGTTPMDTGCLSLPRLGPAGPSLHAFRGTVRATTADGRVPVLPGLLAGQQEAAAARRSPSLPARAVLDGDSDRGVHVESLPAQDAEISFCGLAHVARVRGGVLRFHVILSLGARHREFRDWMPTFDVFGLKLLV